MRANAWLLLPTIAMVMGACGPSGDGGRDDDEVIDEGAVETPEPTPVPPIIGARGSHVTITEWWGVAGQSITTIPPSGTDGGWWQVNAATVEETVWLCVPRKTETDQNSVQVTDGAPWVPAPACAGSPCQNILSGGGFDLTHSICLAVEPNTLPN